MCFRTSVILLLDPSPTPTPRRPDVCFMWLIGPWKTLKYVIWRNYKWAIIKALFVALFVAFVGLLLYAMPGSIIDKMFSLS